MKVIEYIAEVLPDGSLTLPDNIRKELGSQTQIKVTLAVETPSMPDPQKGWQIFKDLLSGLKNLITVGEGKCSLMNSRTISIR